MNYTRDPFTSEPFRGVVKGIFVNRELLVLFPVN